ncbi:MAG TPA: 1-phosphofructokinase family hexose kinase [Kineosporiaceae bacterium]|nr:1-phosphofructokinase family hexose kinase [Kineosporiaceae bacterium]
MIVTITPNPSVDRTLHIPTLTSGAVHRAVNETVEPSGKGVNVALAVHLVGGDVVAVLTAGGHAGEHLSDMIRETGLRHELVPVSGETRSNISLVEPDGTTTKINELGSRLTPEQISQLSSAALHHSRPGDWIVWCGSLPRGFTPQEMATQVAAGRAAGRLVALDSSGEALALAVDGPRDELPHLIKPNTEELAELSGRSLQTVGDVADAAADLVDRGIATVLVSLGVDGAVLAEAGTVLHGTSPATAVVNTAGAGDAFLAGYLATLTGRPAGPPPARERLAGALRFGAAAVAQMGTVFVPPAQYQPVTIQVPDRDQQLLSPVFRPSTSPAQEQS